ncbi:MAG: isochorismatase family cysteine hydrolase [Woeseia sp.]
MRSIGRFTVRDTLTEMTNPDLCALAVVDLQNDFCHPGGSYARCGKDFTQITAMLPRAVGFVRNAQSLGIRCAFIRQVTLPDGRSDSPAWIRFKVRDGKSADYALQDSWGSELIEGLEPHPRDLMIEKFRPDAFHRTPLDLLLRANGIETLIVLGVLTEGCVESTVRSSSYHDYYTIVVEDCVGSTNPINHDGSMNLFRARYPMAMSEELIEVWSSSLGS